MPSKWIQSFLTGAWSRGNNAPRHQEESPSVVITAKRKRALSVEDEESGTDDVQVAQSSYSAKRPPLSEVSHNKRRRYLDHVLVKKVERDESVPFYPSSGSPNDLSSRPTPEAKATGVHTSPARSGRARTTWTRSTILFDSDVDESSADELSALPNTRLRKARAHDDEDDFAPSASSNDDDNAEYISEAESASDGTASARSDESKPELRPQTSSRKVTGKGAAPAANKVTTKNNKNAKGSKKNMINLTKGRQTNGLVLSLPPLHDSTKIIEDLGCRALGLGLRDVIESLQGPLRIATMCSGTESPVLGLTALQEYLRHEGLTFEIEHLFSAEIVAWKQAYIERNFHPPLLFRDITELINAAQDEALMATTAYGQKVPVPKGVHVLIAGTSCVDFSNLNKKKKGINDEGESGSTFTAVLDYCKHARPAIVILENVYGAPWDHMLEEYERAEYVSVGMHVDTKDFYLPQTRQRGYMVCVDKQCLGKGSNAGNIREQIASIAGELKRPASSAVSSFLQSKPQSLVGDQIDEDMARKEIPWSASSLRHSEERNKREVGQSRPYTKWHESGIVVPLDHGDRQFLLSTVERVKDFTDIATLRKLTMLKGASDPRFKGRYWDVSQNIDQGEDNKPLGILGCITPSGLIRISDQNRSITAREKLALHGIDHEKVSLTIETEKQLADLAGNAMSSPVVTAIALSALIAGTEALRQNGHKTSTRAIHFEEEVLPEITSSSRNAIVLSSSLQAVDFRSLLSLADKTLRQCSCEGSTGLAAREIQRCRRCGHTACVSCSGNPEHDYFPGQSVYAKRLEANAFVDYLNSAFPLRIRPPQPKHLDNLSRGKKSNPQLYAKYIECIEAMSQEVFGIQNPRRSFHWTIVYRSETSGSRLEMRLSDNAIDLSLFAEPSADLACDDPLREIFKEPVARAEAETSFSNIEWRWRSVFKTTSPTTISGSKEQLPTIYARYQVPKAGLPQAQPQSLEIGHLPTKLNCHISGTYELLPLCGTSFESLYVRQDAENDKPMFLFHDPEELASPESDTFVFSRNCERLEHGEVRHIKARMPPTWKPWSSKTTNSKLDVSMYEWTVLPDPSPIEEVEVTVKTAGMQGVTDTSEQSGCKGYNINLAVQVNAGCQSKDQLSSSHKWIADVIKQQLPMEEWSIYAAGDTATPCLTCAPCKPEPRWQVKADLIERYEDPETAAEYETAVKCRPTAALVRVQEMSSSVPATVVQFGLNLNTLAHRARAGLPADVSDVQYTWRFTRASNSNSFVRRQFVLNAISGNAPYSGELGMSIDDFQHQRQSLAWMIEQERGKSCIIEAFQDVVLHPLEYRAEMRATTTTEIRGGILADPPGYGKTILTLLRVRIEALKQSRADILANMEPRRPQGLIPTAATLVVCPPHIVEQWTDEITEKLGYEKGVIAISKTQQLSKLTITDIEKAKIVIISRTVLASPGYVDRLAAFAGLPGPAGLRGRQYRDWLKEAIGNFPKHADILKRRGLNQLRTTAAKTYKEAMESDRFKSYVPSRRLRGKNYKAAGKDAERSEAKKGAPAALDTSTVGSPLVEMFYWNRVMYDEFHELNAQEQIAVSTIAADKRWGLSGTPPIGDSYEVSQMASLLGVWLPKGSMRQGIMKQKNAKALQNDMTDFEKFDAQREAQSEAMQERVHELSQGFLDVFVRQNEGFKIPYQDRLVPVSLDLAHRVVYSELSSQLIGQDMVVKKTSTKHRKLRDMPDRDERYSNAVKDITYGEEALSCLAAYFSIDESHKIGNGLDVLVDCRKKRMDRILDSLGATISKAKSRETQRFSDWKTRVNCDGVGDIDTFTMIEKLLVEARNSTKHRRDDSDEEMDDITLGASYYTSKTQTLVKDLVTSQRSLRYAENVCAVQAEESATTAAKLCDGIDCKETGPSDIAVSSACGHAICANCHAVQIKKNENRCPARGCSSVIERHHLLWKSKMSQAQEASVVPYGAKIAVVLDLLCEIRDKDDQAIVFVQFKTQLDELAIALEDRGISAAANVKEFQQLDEDDKKTVIVLSAASGGGAAGLNLQNANHVIFLSPLLRDQQGYDATMEQAIGRVRRYGQEKDVHVYRLAALDTVDVDILELREQRTMALTEQNAPAVKEPAGLAKDTLMIDGDETATASLVGGRKGNSMQLVRDKQGYFSLRPANWLTCYGNEFEQYASDRIAPGLPRKPQERVQGWGDFGSLEKWSKVYVESDE